MSVGDAQALRDAYARTVSRSAVERLRALGHDFVEAGAEGAYLFDENGKRYLDCYCGAGIFNFGRRPAGLASALRDGLRATDQGNFPMVSVEKAAAAERLARFVPGPADCVVFGVVRGEAFDFACKLARGFTGRKALLAPVGSWFGETGFALTLSTHPHRRDFGSLVPDAKIVELASPREIESVITEETAAVLLEPVQAENHCARLPLDAMSALVERCRATGTVLVVDETQTGFGRTGKRFAFEHFGFEPEAVIVGEALGGGTFPICATVISQRLNTFMNAHPLIHLSTFGGSDLGCVVASAALDDYERLRPWENALRQGERLEEALRRIGAAPGSKLRSTGGVGLLRSLDVGDAGAAAALCRDLAAAGVFAKPGRIAAGTVVLRPPLTIGDDDVDLLVAALERSL